MIKYGYITEVDASTGKVRVKFPDEGDDGIVSNPLPVTVPATKNDKYSFPFAINEHVACMMDDNCEFGVVVGAIYSPQNMPPDGASTQSIDIVIGASKLQVKIDRESGNLEIKAAGNIKIEATGNIEIAATGTTNVKGVNVNVEASAQAKVKGATVQIDAPATTMTGTLAVTGGITAATIAAGSFSGPGGGPMQSSANIITAGDVVAGGKSLKFHIHTAPSGGGPTTPPT